jgi:alpha-D-ribose 1-methylphosphonate 5-triphosphate synthase subunit PhnG
MIMDVQQLFNAIVSVAGFLAVYVINTLTRQITKLEDKINEMPHAYVAKDDYRADIAEIKDILKQIFNKLDNKQDKT